MLGVLATGVSLSAIVALSMFVSVVMVPAHEYYNTKVRENVLGERFDPWDKLFSSKNMVVSVLKGKDHAGIEEEVEKYHGKAVYLGRILRLALTSKQVDAVDRDIEGFVMVSEWDDFDTYFKFEKAFQLASVKIVARQGFERKGLFNLATPHFLSIVRMYNYMFSNVADLSKSSKSSPLVEKAQIIGDIAGDENKGIYIWNWILDSEKEEERELDKAYGAKMMSMLSSYGGGPMHMGNSVNDERFSGKFNLVAGVYYPGVAFFKRLLSSEWMEGTLKGKQPGDSLAIVTTPLKLNHPAKPLVTTKLL